jgi:hypothetical protein
MIFQDGTIIDTDYRYFESHRLSSDMAIIFRIDIFGNRYIKPTFELFYIYL